LFVGLKHEGGKLDRNGGDMQRTFRIKRLMFEESWQQNVGMNCDVIILVWQQNIGMNCDFGSVVAVGNNQGQKTRRTLRATILRHQKLGAMIIQRSKATERDKPFYRGTALTGM
jgi:hypothetical protein